MRVQIQRCTRVITLENAKVGDGVKQGKLVAGRKLAFDE